MRICKECKEDKPLTAYAESGRGKTRRWTCRKCCSQAQVLRQQNDPTYKERHRRAVIKHRYGISVEQYDALLEEQGGCCKICGVDSPAPYANFSVDHDHACCSGVKACGNCVRGLLCLRCNNNLGWFETFHAEIGAYLEGPIVEVRSAGL